jgi:hypothetical protein
MNYYKWAPNAQNFSMILKGVYFKPDTYIVLKVTKVSPHTNYYSYF